LQAFDAEPHRHIELFKQPYGRLTLPEPSLSRTLRDPAGAVKASLAAMRGLPALVFLEVARGVNLRGVLTHCEADYRVAWVKEDEAVVGFSKASDLQATRDALGAGDRERFTIIVANAYYFDKLDGKQQQHTGGTGEGCHAGGKKAASKVELDEDGFVKVVKPEQRRKASLPEEEEPRERGESLAGNPFAEIKPPGTPIASPGNTPSLTAGSPMSLGPTEPWFAGDVRRVPTELKLDEPAADSLPHEANQWWDDSD